MSQGPYAPRTPRGFGTTSIVYYYKRKCIFEGKRKPLKRVLSDVDDYGK
jgi:hypothetical protein